MKLVQAMLVAAAGVLLQTLPAAALATPGVQSRMVVKAYERDPLQNLVTWDEHSIFVRGERIMLYSGEFHPFRLPVPALWLDVFQKLKAAGFSAVSFYTDWALHEGQPGHFQADGIFDLEPFFDAASKAGIYLIARPGPYINAEVSGGGYPGWLARYTAVERTPDYLSLTENYVKSITQIIAKGQITNGGPVILFQPENEYTNALPNIPFPDRDYFAAVERMFRENGIVVPFINNDAGPQGNFAPGSGTGAVDIYSHDGYPLGFDCANPETWPDSSLPSNWLDLHLKQSPSTPYSISEFQGGSFDPWGGQGFAKCTELLNEKFERVFFKNNYAAGVTIFSLYMVYGGTNWGNLGHPGGYTSYDYGAIIDESRSVAREKYSELKLQANFFKVSPAYLTATPHNSENGSYVNTQDISTAILTGNGTQTNIYIVRHAAYNSLDSTEYKLQVNTTRGSVSIPQLNGSLVLNGRDSKMHVTDYAVGKFNMLYSSAEVFTWKQYQNQTILLLYGGAGETHEAAFSGQRSPKILEGSGVTLSSKNGTAVFNWAVTSQRKVLKFSSGLYVYLLDRNDVYNYWVLDLPAKAPTNQYSHASAKSIIARAGYLLRTASVSGNTLAITGDLNATATLEIVGGASSHTHLSYNGQTLKTKTNSYGVISAPLVYTKPDFKVPSLATARWKYLDSLPEIQKSYSDNTWPAADHSTTNNTVRNLTTPTSLYGSDYGFNTGILVTRGHFTGNGKETALNITTQGGTAFGSSVWLDDMYLGSWYGNSVQGNASSTYDLTGKTTSGTQHVLTVVSDNMGLDEDYVVGADGNKDPRGVLDYDLAGRDKSEITWKITGNLGGESYADKTRGPLNEGGTYAERQGYHLPGAPSGKWKTQSPFEGLSAPGIGFYATIIQLQAPKGYDIPMSFRFTNTTGNGSSNYRVQLWANGFQYAKFVNNIGPQTEFPVPQGILNYNGTNYIAVSLWAMDTSGAKLGALELVPTALIQSGYGDIAPVPAQQWKRRSNAY